MKDNRLLAAYIVAVGAFCAAAWLCPRGQTEAPVLESRSPDWPAVRAAYMRGHPVCEACGAADGIEVHHVVPVSHDPSKELDVTNLIALCRKGRNCHFKLGHQCDDGKSNWSCGNPDVRADAARQLWELYGAK